jgi:iron complex outermembrane receptor protein
MNIPIDPEDLGHVEVVRSGSGPWAGIGVFAGGILLETRVEEKPTSASFTAELGSFNWTRLRANAQASTGKIRHSLSLSQAKTDGYIPNSDMKINRLFWGARLRSGASEWKSLLAAESKSFGAQNFYSSTFPNQHEETVAAVAQLVWSRQQGNWNASAAGHLRAHSDRFELYREEADWYSLTEDGFFVAPSLFAVPDTAAGWYQGANLHRSMVGAVNGQLSWLGDAMMWTAAFDARTESIRSNRLGLAVEGDTEYGYADDRLNVDAYVSGKYFGLADRLAVTATMAVNENSRFGNSLLPAVNARMAFGTGDQIVVFGSAGRSVRHPSFTDLYYTLGGAVGSEDLKSEYADQGEVGARWNISSSQSTHQFSIETTRFIRQGRNLIDWVQFDGSDLYEATNVAEVDFFGGDLSMLYQRADAPKQLHLRSLRLGAAWLEANRVASGFTSNYVFDYMRNKYDIVVNFGTAGPLDFSVRGSAQNRNVQSAISEDLFTHLWGADINFQGNDGASLRWRGSVRLDNLFDVEFADRGQVLQPGRMVRFGLTFEWAN